MKTEGGIKIRGVQLWRLLGHYGGVGGLAGLLLGIFEAMRLSSRSAGIPTSAVGSGIWFIAPLADSVAGAFIAMAAAGVIAITKNTHPWQGVIRACRAHSVSVAAVAICAALSAAATILAGTVHPSRFAMKTAAILALITGCAVAGRRLRFRTLGVTLASIWLILLAGLAVHSARGPKEGTALAESPAANDRPSIIFITLDTVRADHLSLYGYPRPTSPHLSQWARQGVVFENAIAPSSWTLPSHASMFTGLLPHQHGADWYRPIDSNRWTLAEVLRARGYATAGFTSNYWYGEGGWGMDAGFEVYDDDTTSIRHNVRCMFLGGSLLQPLYFHAVRPDYFERRDAHQVNRDVLDWFQSTPSRPYFLFINYYDAHDPYFPPAGFKRKFRTSSANLVERTLPAFQTGDSPRVSSQDRDSLVDAYDECVAYLDGALDGLLNPLSHASGWENTIVIVTSDHGESFGEHGTFSHGLSLYREVLHVPLVIFGPHVPKGLRTPRLVATQDLFSTILEIAEKSGSASYGRGLEKFWKAGPDAGEEAVVSELLPKFHSPSVLPRISLTTSQWQYIRSSQGDEELYAWPRDPAEQVNLAAASDYIRTREELRSRLLDLMRESLRPWEGPRYLSALDEFRRPFVIFAASLAESRTGTHVPIERIGDAQNRFPPKSRVPSGPQKGADNELLRSLPYN